ncbi:hypothetical protein RUM43_006843 [Polyplax serrata]|uniref:Uncharacterized protein n=1 Tax=Polyplax serrata TaxID=468196 RepID=A0AAN8PBP8_POLSC
MMSLELLSDDEEGAIHLSNWAYSSATQACTSRENAHIIYIKWYRDKLQGRQIFCMVSLERKGVGVDFNGPLSQNMM